jgi:hypothetical protein
MAGENENSSNVTVWPPPAPKFGPQNLDLPVGIVGMDVGDTAAAQRTAQTTNNFVNEYSKMISQLAGGGGGASASDTLAREKWQAELASAAEARRRREAQLALMQQRLQSGGYREGIDAALRGISGMEAETRKGVQDIYGQAMKDIGAGYGAAQGLTTKGFDALSNYLAQNQVNPYEGLTQQMTTLSNPMEQTLAAYGITAPDVAQQLQAETLAGRQGAEAFQSLLGVLSGAQTSALQSRGAEAEMARQIAAQRLGQERAAFESRAGQARQQSLSDLARWVAEQRFAQEQDAIGRRQDLIDTLISEGIDPETGADTTMTKVERVASTAKNLREAAKEFAPKYMKNNPKATVADITKKFPKLAEAVKAAKSK